MSKNQQTMKGFTLIEILVVIGIIAILASIVIIAINPARQFGQANDTTRQSNINTILNAIGQNMADNKGQLGGACSGVTLPTTTAGEIGTAGSVDLSCLTPTYVTAIPADPVGGDSAHTKYTVKVDSNGRVTVAAVGQITTNISITR